MKTFGKIKVGDTIFVVAKAGCKISIKEAKVTSIDPCNTFLEISGHYKEGGKRFYVWVKTVDSSTKFSYITHQACCTTLDEAKTIRKQACLDRMFDLDKTIAKYKELKEKWETYYHSLD